MWRPPSRHEQIYLYTEKRLAQPVKEKDYVAAFCAVAVAIAVVYWDVLRSLGLAWYTDDNYSHGFFIAPLAAYFAWERRAEFTARPIKPSAFGMVVVAASLVLLVGGILGAELFISRVSFLGVLTGTILFLYGWQRLRVLMFPLAFMLLMIPIPAIIFNQIAFPLQLLASNVGEYTISSLDIPILREGNVLILANAQLEVAEACSGIRSLVSLFTLGLVFGYFVDKRAWVRVVIALSSVPVAILANGLRVASAGVAAHNFGSAGVEGLFHEFSGWVVFVFAFLMMFGSSTPATAILAGECSAARRQSGHDFDMKAALTRAAMLCGLLATAGVFLSNARKPEAPLARTSLSEFPMNIGTWRAVVDPPLEKEILAVLGVDDYLSRVYYKPNAAGVGLYLGYYGSQRQGDTIHSPQNCLPGAGWEPVSEGRLLMSNVDGAGRDITINRYVIQKGLDQKRRVVLVSRTRTRGRE